VAGDGSPLIEPQVAPIAEALQAARFGAPYLVGNAAQMLAERWPADAPAPVKVDPQPAPDITWVAWLGAAADPATAPARPFYLRAPDAKPSVDALPRQADSAATS
jgi:tRNA threonylcarbamoyladenosine biosynthesis protein TsaB